MKIGWYFSDESSPSDELVDKFADSKFGMDRWTSFSREIIQNSLDACDDESQPVEVIFDLNKGLTIHDIPGATYTRYVLERCANQATNRQTKQAYQKGLEILDRPYVYCLKVSDRNTKGVKTGRDEAWGAFVYDEGRSVKQRPGSAGSHGVGKKVPFIISTCNTVFYATKNKYEIDGIEHSDRLFQGKTMLINWEDEPGQGKSPKGWFGVLNKEDVDRKKRVLPIQNEEMQDIHPYFVREDAYGTDVIIVGVNAYDMEEKIQKTIISSIYENFFIAIKERKLKVTVFGIEIHSGNMDRIFQAHYEPTGALKNSMNDLLRIYAQEPVVLPIKHYSEEIGHIRLYFEAVSEANKKYYTIVRNHGMKICESYISSADKAFSAIAIIEGKKLNELLASLENAAHDAFVTDDPNIDYEENAKSAHAALLKVIKEYILEHTQIDEGEDQKIEGLSQILAVPGFTPKITKNDPKAKIRRNKVNRPKPRKPVAPKPPVEPETSPAPEDNSTSRKRKTKVERVYNAYTLAPVLVKTADGYLLRVEVKHDMKDCEFRIRSINSDERVDSSITDLLLSATDGWKKYKIQDGCISKMKLEKNHLYEIHIKTSRDIKYRLTAELWYKEA